MPNNENQVRCRSCGELTSEAEGGKLIRGQRIIGIRAYCPECQ